MSMAANLIIACVCVFCGYKLGERDAYKAVVEAEKKLATHGPAEEEAAT